MGGNNGKANGETADALPVGGETKPGPFRLVRAMIDAATRCAADSDPTPYAVVVPSDVLDVVTEAWAALDKFPDAPETVQMNPVPDMKAPKYVAVLLFARVPEGGPQA